MVMMRRLVVGAILCCLVSTVYASEKRRIHSVKSAAAVQEGGAAANGAAPAFSPQERLLQKLEVFTSTLAKNSEDDDAAEAKLKEFCDNLETPAHKKAIELEAELKEVEKTISAKKDISTKEIPESLEDGLQQLEDEIGEQETIIEPITNARAAALQQRAAFLTMLDTMHDDVAALSKSFEDGLTAGASSQESLLQVAEEDAQLHAHVANHRFRSSSTRIRRLHTVKSFQSVSESAPADMSDPIEQSIMGIVSYSSALSADLVQTKDELTTLGENVKSAVSDELTKRGGIVSGKMEEKSKLQDEKDAFLAERAEALKLLPDLVKEKLLAETKLAAANAQIAKENNPCELYQQEYQRRRDHREDLKKVAEYILTQPEKDAKKKKEEEGKKAITLGLSVRGPGEEGDGEEIGTLTSTSTSTSVTLEGDSLVRSPGPGAPTE